MINVFIATTVILSISSLALVIALIKTNKEKSKMAERLSDRDEIANESYANFVDSSRKMAYEYIENVQNVLNSFKTRVEPQLDYFNRYGKDTQSPHITMLNQIADAYEELKAILPEEENQGDK